MKTLRKLKTGIQIAAGVFALLGSSQISHAAGPATHGFVIFGNEKGFFASHLPMYHAPHDWQVVLEIEFNNPRDSAPAREEILKAQAKGEKLFTFLPSPFDLEKLSPGMMPKPVLLGQVYLGHFERGGIPLARANVAVSQVLFKNRLKANDPKNDQYLLFGNAGGYFMVHLVGGKPNFDHIVQATDVSQEKVIQSCPKRPCKRDGAEETVWLPVQGNLFPVVINKNQVVFWEPLRTGQVVYTDDILNAIRATVGEEIYLEKGDLSQ